MEKSEIEIGLPYKIPDLMHKFQIICTRGTYFIERKPNTG
jgi:hypothetical protein